MITLSTSVFARSLELDGQGRFQTPHREKSGEICHYDNQREKVAMAGLYSSYRSTWRGTLDAELLSIELLWERIKEKNCVYIHTVSLFNVELETIWVS